MLESGFKYATQSKLYIWKRRKNKVDQRKTETSRIENKSNTMSEYGTRLSGGKLRDLAWSLDVLDLSKEGNTKKLG